MKSAEMLKVLYFLEALREEKISNRIFVPFGKYILIIY